MELAALDELNSACLLNPCAANSRSARATSMASTVCLVDNLPWSLSWKSGQEVYSSESNQLADDLNMEELQTRRNFPLEVVSTHTALMLISTVYSDHWTFRILQAIRTILSLYDIVISLEQAWTNDAVSKRETYSLRDTNC